MSPRIFEYRTDKIIEEINHLKVVEKWPIEMIGDALGRGRTYMYDLLNGVIVNNEYARYENLLHLSAKRDVTKLIERVLHDTEFHLVRKEKKSDFPPAGSCKDAIYAINMQLANLVDAEQAGNAVAMQSVAKALRLIASRIETEARAKMK